MDLDLDMIDLEASIESQAARLDRICREAGFFRIPLTCVSEDVAAEAWDLAAEFFASSEAAKRSVEFPEPGYPYGYSPFRFETLGASLGQVGEPDLKESFSVGPDTGGRTPGPDADEAWVQSPSLWPDVPAGIERAWGRYFRELSGVAARLMEATALALGMPTDHFDLLIDRPITSMRAIHYPRLDTAPAPGALRAGAHTDYGTFTILRTDDVAGLEIQAPGGTWLPVAPRPDSLVVNLGDSIARWTNDRWRSTIHRVTITDPAPRHSMAFFHMANWDAAIETLPTCVGVGEPARYGPVKAGPWLMQKFQATIVDHGPDVDDASP